MKRIFKVFIFLICSVCHGAIVVTSGLTEEFRIAKGQNVNGRVVVKNTGKTFETAFFYFKDIVVGCESEAFNTTESGTTTSSNSNWIQLAVEERNLAPGEEFSLAYEVKIPRTVKGGTYYSVLMVEEKAPIDTTTQQFGISVKTNIRYGVQIITTVEGDEEPNLSFEKVEVNPGDTSLTMNILLKNLSTELVRPSLKVEIYSETGDIIDVRNAQTSKLYPGQCKSFEIPLRRD